MMKMICAWNYAALACLTLMVLNSEAANSSFSPENVSSTMTLSSVDQLTTASLHVSSVFQSIAASVNLSTTLQTTLLTSTASAGTTHHYVTIAPTSPSAKPDSSWAEKILAKVDPLIAVIILICAAGLIIILVTALCCVCCKYHKVKRLSSLKHPYIGHDNIDWVRGNDNVMMWERNLRAGEVTPHYPMDYASVNSDRPPSYAPGYIAPDHRISGPR